MATSGSISSSTAFGNVTLSWSRTSVDVSANTSTISYTLSIYSSSNISSSASKSYSIVFNGTTVASGTVTVGGSGTRTLKSGSTTIAHNADGTKTFNYSFSQQIDIWWGSTWVGTVTGSGSSTLDSIARASQPSLSANSVAYGSSVTIYTNRASTGFTHTVRTNLKDGGNVTIATGVGDSWAWSVPMDYMTYIPNGLSVYGTLWLDTYNGGTLIGTKSVTITLTVPSSVVPTFTSVTHSENVSSVSTSVGMYVQGQSKLNLAINGATGAYGSTIKTYSITFEGTSYPSATAVSGVIKGSGTLTISATITDSRGRTATKTATVTVLAYSPPSVSVLTPERVNSNGTANQLGTYIKLTRSATATSLKNGTTEKNVLKYTIKTKLRSASTWNTTKQQVTVSGLSLTGADNPISSTSTFDVTKSYDIMLEITDLFNTTLALGVISSGQVTMSWGREGVGIGKVWESGALDVGGDINFIGGKISSNSVAVFNPNNPSANATFGWLGDVPRVRIGGNGTGANAGFQIVGTSDLLKWGVDGNGNVTNIGELGFAKTLSSANRIMNLQQGYALYSDNAGSGGNNTRLWLDTPNNAELVFGPRAGGDLIGNFRLRSKSINLEGNVTVYGDRLYLTSSGASAPNLEVPVSNGDFYIHRDASNYTRMKVGSTDFYFSGSNYWTMNSVGLYNNYSYVVLQSAGDRVYLQSPVGVSVVKPNTTATYVPILASAFTVNSERKVKKNIKKQADGALSKVVNTPTYEYHLISEIEEYETIGDKYVKVGDKDVSRVKKRTGLILEEAPEEIVFEDGIDLYAMNTTLWKAVQELSARLDVLNEKIKRR